MYRVALVGHSNLPVFPGWGNAQIESFKVQGAKLTDLRDQHKFGASLFTTNWDCVIVFLGGNDIAGCRNQDDLFNRYLSAFRVLHTTKLVVTEVEPRTYNREYQSRFGINTLTYNTIAKILNKKLKRYAKRTSNVELVHIPSGYMNGSVDGIHLSPEGQQHLITKYKLIIDSFR